MLCRKAYMSKNTQKIENQKNMYVCMRRLESMEMVQIVWEGERRDVLETVR
jgi:hypothetical protein